MERFIVKLEVSLFAENEQDAEQLGALLAGAMNTGQRVVRVTGVRPEVSHEDCQRIGVCICGR